VDPFVLIMVGLVGGLLVAVLLLGYFYPGSGAEQLDWRPTRSADVEAQNEIDDFDQMRAAVNEKRKRRGLGEISEDQVYAQAAEDRAFIDEHRRRIQAEDHPE
jgi:hypothetical protein